MSPNPAVILTQEEQDNARLADLLAARGMSSISYPCICTSYIPFDPHGEIAGIPLREYGLVAFTSRRGVIGFEPASQLLEQSRPVVACVGESTAAEFESRFGFKAEIMPPENRTGAGLAGEICSRINAPVPVLYVRGTRASGEFSEPLRRRGWQVGELTVYRNDQPQMQPLALAGQAVAVFASPSAAARFFQVNPGMTGSIPCVAIGPVTQRSLRELGVERITAAARPHLESVAESVEILLREAVANGTQTQ